MIDSHVEINTSYNILLHHEAYKTTIHNQEEGIDKWHEIDDSRILSLFHALNRKITFRSTSQLKRAATALIKSVQKIIFATNNLGYTELY